jgi:hypothetical protein
VLGDFESFAIHEEKKSFNFSYLRSIIFSIKKLKFFTIYADKENADFSLDRGESQKRLLGLSHRLVHKRIGS